MVEKCITVFNENEESWESYIERLEQYFELNNMAAEKKVPALLTFIGPKVYQLLKDFVSPQRPSEKSYAEIVNVLKDHLTPKTITIAERFKFSKRVQQDGERPLIP